MDTTEIAQIEGKIALVRGLRAGDILVVPSKAPFCTHYIAVRGHENETVKGLDWPYVTSAGFTRIFPHQIESVIPYEEAGRPIPFPASRHYTLGDPLFPQNEGEE